MTRIFWDTFFLISGSLFTLGAGPSNSTVVKSTKASTSDSAAAGNTRPPTTEAAAANIPPVQSFLFPTRAEQSNMVASEASIPSETAFTAAEASIPSETAFTAAEASIPSETAFTAAEASIPSETAFTAAEASIPNETAFTAALSTLTSSSAGTVTSAAAPIESFLSTSGADLGNTTAAGANSSADTISAAAGAISASPVKKFVAAAVWSHFDECPDSHRHFCFHGTCRFLILEEKPTCVCHQGFIGMRCEHADLLAVVATNHRQTVTTVLVLCVIGCVLVMVLFTLLHCWWRQECRRQRHAHHYCQHKHGVSFHPSESVV